MNRFGISFQGYSVHFSVLTISIISCRKTWVLQLVSFAVQIITTEVDYFRLAFDLKLLEKISNCKKDSFPVCSRSDRI